jgi:hypothetical protein
VIYSEKGLKSLTMPFQPSHTGLFVPSLFLDSSREARESRTLISAWMTLDDTPPDDVLHQLLWLVYRWRTLEDTAAGQKALMMLHSLDDATLFTNHIATDRARLVALANLIEMLRSHPSATPALIQLFRHWVDSLSDEHIPSDDASYWHVTLRLAAAVVLDDETLFDQGVKWFEEAIAQLHPEGYVREAVEGKHENTFAQQLSIACALTLAAEIGVNNGVDLWATNNRGVSAKTAAAYVLYYLFYPEKWRWTAPGILTADVIKPLIKERAAFIEIVNARSPLRTADLLLQQNRPLISLTGGGMTTLVYGAPPALPASKPWWQFWG